MTKQEATDFIRFNQVYTDFEILKSYLDGLVYYLSKNVENFNSSEAFDFMAEYTKLDNEESLKRIKRKCDLIL